MRVMLPALALLVAACSSADKADDAADGGSAAADMSAGELAELESAISDSTVAEVVADDPGGRLADAPSGPAMADPLATPMPEAPIMAAPDSAPQAAEPSVPAGN